MERIMRQSLLLAVLVLTGFVPVFSQSPHDPLNTQCDFTVTPAITHVTCFGDEDGAIELSAENTVGNVSFEWLSLQVLGPSVDDLPAGNYNVRVSDDECSEVIQVEVTEPDNIVINPNNGSICEGTSTNLLNAVSGGTPPYTYSWTTENGSSSCISCLSHTIVPPISDTYDMIVTDDNGCTKTQNVVVNVKDVVDFSVSNPIPETCGHDGKLVASAWGGSGQYRYSFNNSPLVSNTFADTLTAGQKTVKVYDFGYQCQREYTATVVDNKLVLDDYLETEQVSCPDSGNGSIIVHSNAQNTSGYSLSANGPFTSNNTFTDFTGGTHSVYIEDNNGCVFERSIEVFEPEAPNLHANALDVTCFGADDGRLVCSVTNGTVPIDAFFIDGIGENETGIFNNLPPGEEVVVYVRDINNCVFSDTVSIVEPDEIVVDSVELRSVTCPGGEDGKIVVIVSGGTAIYEYTIGGDWQEPNEFDGLVAGDYTVFIRDSNDCIIEEMYTIEEPEEMVVNGEVDGAKCNDGCDGKIVVIVSGGTAMYEYSGNGNNWQSSNTFDDLCSGVYEIYVRDANGCETVELFAVDDPTAIVIDGDVTQVGEEGQIDATISGGTPPYDILWSNGATSEDVSNLGYGVYTINVTDSNGCTSDEVFDLTFLTLNDGSIRETDILVYPNPFNDKVLLKFGFKENKQITAYITDMPGKLVTQPVERDLNEGVFIFSTESLPAGMYLVNLEIDGVRLVKKIVKN